MGGNLEGQSVVQRAVLLEGVLALNGVKELGLMAARKLDVDDGTHDLADAAVLDTSVLLGALLLELLVLREELLEVLLTLGIGELGSLRGSSVLAAGYGGNQHD